MQLTSDISPGNTQFTVSSTTGIVQGLAADNGSGDAIFVNNVAGNTISMSGSFTSSITRNTETYTAVSGTLATPAGLNATFDINRSGTVYSVTAVAQTGSNYKQGDRIRITGDNLGGLTPANDAIVRVDSVNGTGGVVTASVTGTALSGSITYENVSATYNHGAGNIGTTTCLLYTSPSPRDATLSRMPSSA